MLDPAGQPREVGVDSDANFQPRVEVATDAPPDKRPLCCSAPAPLNRMMPNAGKLVAFYRHHFTKGRCSGSLRRCPVKSCSSARPLARRGSPCSVTPATPDSHDVCSRLLRLEMSSEWMRRRHGWTKPGGLDRNSATTVPGPSVPCFAVAVWSSRGSPRRRSHYRIGILPTLRFRACCPATMSSACFMRTAGASDGDTVREAITLLSDQRKVTSWGKAPLYLAICKAVEDDLAFQPKTAPRRLFVITDGQDEPFFPGDNSSPIPTTNGRGKTSCKPSNRDAGGNKAEQVQLYLVGWDLLRKPDLRDWPGAVGILFNLETPAGEVRSVDLLQTLRRYLGLFEYDVFTSDNRHVGSRKMLNESLTIEDHPAAHGKTAWREYFLSLVDQPRRYPFALEGGESLLWTLARHDGVTPTLEHSRYDFGGEVQRTAKATRLANPNRQPADFDFNPPFFYAVAATPDVRGGDVVFPISIQNDDPTRFSPKPSELWVEITPLVSNEDRDPTRLPPYVFNDLGFEPNYPVPRVHCTASGWPPEADSADIELWFKLRGHETVPVVHRRIQDIQGFDERMNPDLDVNLADGPPLHFSAQLEARGRRPVKSSSSRPATRNFMVPKLKSCRRPTRFGTPITSNEMSPAMYSCTQA